MISKLAIIAALSIGSVAGGSLAGISVAVAAEPAVTIEQQPGGKYAISIGGEPFAIYNANLKGKLPKPFMSEVRGPGGTILSRRILEKAGSEKQNLGHKHHKGIWVAVDEVNEVRFWAEKGKIKTYAISTATGGGPAKINVENLWLDADGKVVVREKTKILIHANRSLSYDITFRAGDKPVTFRDTKEGLFGFRMVKSMRENESGHVENSAGAKGTKNCWGKTADWIDYYGPVDGKTFGVAIFDHPGNFRKSRYHVRNYGLFSINPFGQKAYTGGKQPAQPHTIAPGKTLHLRYGIFFHAGDTKAANVGEVYEKFVKDAK